jgi:hypothetical protein
MDRQQKDREKGERKTWKDSGLGGLGDAGWLVSRAFFFVPP